MGQPQEGRCRGCGQTIVWLRTHAGRPTPCDPKEVTLVADDGKVVKGRVSHFATCPKAGTFRKAG